MATQLSGQKRSEQVIHNLNGQRIGRKGQITRQRILDSARKLIDQQDDLQISLSMIAEEASLKLTSVYNYFSDLSDVLVALLDEVMADANSSYLDKLRTRWEDENLAAECDAFVHAIFEFWGRHSNLLHLRNNFADSRNPKMINRRVTAADKIIGLIIFQFDIKHDGGVTPYSSMASAIFMGIERAISVLYNKHLLVTLPHDFRPYSEGLLNAEARLLELGIRQMRQHAKNG